MLRATGQTFILSDILAGSYTLASPPSAVGNARKFAWFSDAGPDGALMMSDGTSWNSLSELGTPVARTVALATAYQATNPALPALITLNLDSTSTNSLLDGSQASQKGEVYIANTAAGVTGKTGTKISTPENTQGGVLVVGLTITQRFGNTVVLMLPRNWYFGVHRITGNSLSVASAFDQAII